MAKKRPLPQHHAQTVHDCWLIARHFTERHQNSMNRAQLRHNARQYALCKAARDACDRVALAIRYGVKRGRKGRKK